MPQIPRLGPFTIITADTRRRPLSGINVPQEEVDGDEGDGVAALPLNEAKTKTEAKRAVRAHITIKIPTAKVKEPEAKENVPNADVKATKRALPEQEGAREGPKSKYARK